MLSVLWYQMEVWLHAVCTLVLDGGMSFMPRSAGSHVGILVQSRVVRTLRTKSLFLFLESKPDFFRQSVAPPSRYNDEVTFISLLFPHQCLFIPNIPFLSGLLSATQYKCLISLPSNKVLSADCTKWVTQMEMNSDVLYFNLGTFTRVPAFYVSRRHTFGTS